MPLYLDTSGNSTRSIAVCDRCKMKRPHAVMRNDPNFPGLRVCDQGCADQFDPYRLPARKTERITIRFPRPDANIAVDDNNLITTGDNEFVISTQENDDDPSNNGNLTGIEV